MKLTWFGIALGISTLAAASPPNARKIIAKVFAEDNGTTIMAYGIFEDRTPQYPTKGCYRASQPATKLTTGANLPQLLDRINHDPGFTHFVFQTEAHQVFPHYGFSDASLTRKKDGSIALVLTPQESWSQTLELPYCTADDITPVNPDKIMMRISSPSWVCGPETRGKGPTLEIYQRSFQVTGALMYSLNIDIPVGEVTFTALHVEADTTREKIEGKTVAANFALEVDMTQSTLDHYGESKHPAKLTLSRNGKNVLNQADYHCLGH